jgi:hypothetical protein
MSSGIHTGLDPNNTIEELTERLHNSPDRDERAAARDALTLIGERQARSLQPHPLVKAGKGLVIGFFTVVQILFSLVIIAIVLLRIFLMMGAH